MNLANPYDQYRNMVTNVELTGIARQLVPFFKTVIIFFIFFGSGPWKDTEMGFYCIIKNLPIIALMIFVVLHGMGLTEEYSYSRKILLGLLCSCVGDAFIVWGKPGCLVYGFAALALAHLIYTTAFGLTPLRPYTGAGCGALALITFYYVLPGLRGSMVYLAALYLTLIGAMVWRGSAKVRSCKDLSSITRLCAFFGVTLFALSDLLLVVDKFRSPLPYSHPVIMLCYYTSQLSLALSVVPNVIKRRLKNKTS